MNVRMCKLLDKPIAKMTFTTKYFYSFCCGETLNININKYKVSLQ